MTSSKVYKVIGLMSGTSLDGVDAAILETDGERIFGCGHQAFRAFSKDERQILECATQDALSWQFKGAPPNSLAQAETIIHKAHAKLIETIEADEFEMIGFHGQTVLHHPAQKGERGQTLQLGNGQVLADRFGVPCAFDFRSTDVAAGGQGAPLAPIYHKALCEYSKLEGRMAIVNIGGVSNMTLVDEDASLIATDCGPGNGPLDSWMRLKTGKSYDNGGRKSLEGNVSFKHIEQWLKRDFFMRSMPRSADRYDFDVLTDIRGLSVEDGAATLASFTAQAIARDLKAYSPDRVIICGGGRHNPAIMGMLQSHIKAPVETAEKMGWDGDALEAQAFAYLAVRSLRGLPISFPGTTGIAKPMTGGRIAYPAK